MRKTLAILASALIAAPAAAQTLPNPRFIDAWNNGGKIPLLSNNLSDLPSAPTARTNLGLGTLAILNTLPVPGVTTLGGTKSVVCTTNQFVNGIDTGGNPTCAIPTTGSSTAAAGSNGQFQTNSSGSLAGVTISGDLTISGTTGVGTITNGAVTSAKMASGAAVGNLGYTPVNKVGDTMTGPLTMNMATPDIDWIATGNAADAKRWRLIGDTSGNLVFQTVNDANTAALNALYFTRTGATPTGIQSAVPINFGAAQTNVGQSLSISDAGPANWATFTGIRDPLRVSVNGFTTTSEFGGAVGIPDVNAIVGGTICPANYNAINGAYCGGVAGYGFNLRPATSNANYQTASGVAGYAGVGVNSTGAWGIVGFVTNCNGTNCASNTGYEGTASVPMLLSSAEFDLTTFKLAAGTNPKYTTATGLLIQGTADSQARFDRANGSTVYGLTIQVLDTNSYVNKNCDGTGTQSNCWDAAIKVADGSSAVALQVGATTLNSPAAAAPSQSVAFFSYNSSGVAQVATDFLSATASRTLQYPAGGSVTFSENGTLRGSLQGTAFRIEGTVATAPITVGTLPTCNSALQGARSFVTDASSSGLAWGAAVAGGGTTHAGVVCNSVGWIYG